jgi:hypothetical protein
MTKFNQTNPEYPSFRRHLDACGINSQMNKSRRAKKFLWGTKNSYNEITWKSLDSLDSLDTYDLNNIKSYLSNYKHSFEDEQIGWVFDLVDYTLEYKAK